MSKRAIRRHHRERLSKTRKWYWHWMDNNYNHIPLPDDCLNTVVETPCTCSCHMCRNPRRSIFTKGNEKRTVQERREYQYKITDYLDEFYG